MQIHIERGRVWNLSDLPDHSIALDGAVPGPEIDPIHHRYSFDHHQNCIRFCTTSACQQAWTAVKLGLDPENYNIFCNDVDIDVCMAIYCLSNPDRCNEPLIIKLVNAIGCGDCHLGAISLNGMGKTVEWISAPETESKRHEDYHKLSSEGLNSILESILHRIDLYADGLAASEIAKQPKHNDCKILRNENDYVVVESHDPHVFGQLYQMGFDRIVLVRPQSDKSLAITFAKKSDFIDNFPLEKMYAELNKLEQGWGGSTTAGGAPRNSDGSRSKLPLDKIIEIIDNIVKN